MTGSRSRLAATVATVVAAVAVLNGCADQGTVSTQRTAGDGGVAINVLIVTSAVPALRCLIKVYVRRPGRGIKFGDGSAEAIATTVKNGHRVDVVILPTGSALNRVRDELATPATPLARSRTTRYWVGDVTNKGLAFASFLTSQEAHLALASHACTSTRLAR